MSDILEIFGTEYSGVTGIKATDNNGNTLTYIRPTGTKSITANGSGIDVTEYASVDVSVSAPTSSLQTKTKSYTPTESAQSETVTADTGYDGLDEVNISVGAISSTYVGSGITQRSSSDLTASGATVTAPAGYYASNATKTISSGSATPASTISGTSATVSTSGSSTLTLSKTVSNTPIVSAGYISSGTSGNTSVTLSASVDIRSSSNLTANALTVTAPSGYYASSASKTLSDANLIAGNIKNGVTIFGVTGNYSGESIIEDTVTTLASGGDYHAITGATISGTLNITENGTYNVSNYASASVNVTGGGSSIIPFTIKASNSTGTTYFKAIMKTSYNGHYGKQSLSTTLQEYYIDTGELVVISSSSSKQPRLNTSSSSGVSELSVSNDYLTLGVSENAVIVINLIDNS